MMNGSSVIAAILITFFLCIGFSSPSYATVTDDLNQNTTYRFESNTHDCLFGSAPAGSGISSAAWKNEMYTGRMVYCMRQLLNGATKAFLNKITQDYGLGVVAASVVFAFGMFGVRLSLGMLQNLKSETFTFLFKIGLVFLILNNTDFVVDFWYDTLDMFLEMVAFGMKDLLTGLNCQAVGSGSLGDWFMVWSQFDCLFAKFVGFGASKYGIGILALAGLLASSGSIGLWVAYTAFGAFYAIAQFLFRCAMIALLSYGGLGLMLMMLPLFLPLLLFKQTEDFLYKAWLPFAIGYVLQPAICIAFMIFALNVLDYVIMQGSDGIYMQYTASQHEVVYTVSGYAPPNAEKAVKTANEVRGIDQTKPADVQMTQIKKTVKQVNSSGKMIQETSNYTSFKSKDCGKLGNQQTSKNDISDKAVSDDKNFKNCTDPAKCKEAYKNNLPNAPSTGSANAARNNLCDTGVLSAGGNAAQGIQTLDSHKSTMTQEALDLGADQEKGLAAILAYVAMLIVTAGTFYQLIEYVPGIVEALSSSRSPKMSLHSPSIAGKSVAQRLENALKQSHQSVSNMNNKFSQSKQPDEKGNFFKRTGQRAMGGAGSFVRGFMG